MRSLILVIKTQKSNTKYMLCQKTFVLVEDMYMEDTYLDEYNTEVFWIFQFYFNSIDLPPTHLKPLRQALYFLTLPWVIRGRFKLKVEL